MKLFSIVGDLRKRFKNFEFYKKVCLKLKKQKLILENWFLNNIDGFYWLVMKCMVFKKYLNNVNMFIEKMVKLKQLLKLQLNCV